MGVGRLDRLPAGTLRACSAICGALGRASVTLAPRTKGAKTMPTLSIEKNRNLESAIPKKGSAQSFASRWQKAPSGAASPKKQLRPVGSKPARATGAEQPTKADEPPVERI